MLRKYPVTGFEQSSPGTKKKRTHLVVVGWAALMKYIPSNVTVGKCENVPPRLFLPVSDNEPSQYDCRWFPTCIWRVFGTRRQSQERRTWKLIAGEQDASALSIRSKRDLSSRSRPKKLRRACHASELPGVTRAICARLHSAICFLLRGSMDVNNVPTTWRMHAFLSVQIVW